MRWWRSPWRPQKKNAETQRNYLYQNSKRTRTEEAHKLVEACAGDLSRARRMLINRDSAAARRKKDNVYRQELELLLRRLEKELDALEERKKKKPR
mmetsp:Transcript_16801/g.68716  ORF Transcript_16801/g.68716 Transcript_16801/m.68716 type:complete len:96 (-) Transcript_16801:1497-1784(-)